MSAEHKMAPHAGLVIGRETPDQPAIHRLLELSDAYAASLYPAESNHLVDVATLLQPNVVFLVARQAGAIIGCGSVVLHCEEPAGAYAEIKRMYVDEHVRGLKLGRRLLEALEAELPAQAPAPRPAPRRSLAERDAAARAILREEFGMRV